jgi:nicotinate dehydrogenase subunit B
MSTKTPLSRRHFIRNAGGLVIGFSLLDLHIAPRLLAAEVADGSVAGIFPTPSPAQLDSWLKIDKEGIVHVFTEVMDIGTGMKTAYGQIVAEELDVPFEHVDVSMGDTAVAVPQGGVSGSSSVMTRSKPLRSAAATARQLLVEMASKRLNVPPEQLETKNGFVSVIGNAKKSVSYGQLASTGDLNCTMTLDKPNASGALNASTAVGPAKPKDPSKYTIVGKPVQRPDIAAKVLGRYQFVTSVRVPGMLHGRVIRPATVGADVVKVDDTACKAIPGFVQAVVKNNFVGVVAQTEWGAISAAYALKVTWTDPKPVLPTTSENLFEYMRSAPPKNSREAALKRGDAKAAITKSVKTISASYDYPINSHATMGTGCAVADVKEREATVWYGGQKPAYFQAGLAELMNLPLTSVRVVWVQDSAPYGCPGYEDIGTDAALLSQAVGKPVRVQLTREQSTAWQRKAPATACNFTAGFDETGEVNALLCETWNFSGDDAKYVTSHKGGFLGAQLAGVPKEIGNDEYSDYGHNGSPYMFPNIYGMSHVVTGLYAAGPSPLRTAHLRAPSCLETSFGVEQFMDEIAAEQKMDPLEFRIKHLEEAPRIESLKMVKERAKWESRPSPKPGFDSDAEVVTGRGVACSMRDNCYLAAVVEVEVNRSTGVVHIKRIVCSVNAGQIVNPIGARSMVAGCLLSSVSRVMKEEVTFDRTKVTSKDWVSYPVLRPPEVPDEMDIAFYNDVPGAPMAGLGEPASVNVPGAVGNAIFDATGVRIRRAPYTPARVKAALAAAAAQRQKA